MSILFFLSVAASLKAPDVLRRFAHQRAKPPSRAAHALRTPAKPPSSRASVPRTSLGTPPAAASGSVLDARQQPMPSRASLTFDHGIQDAVDLVNHFDRLNTQSPPPENEVWRWLWPRWRPISKTGSSRPSRPWPGHGSPICPCSCETAWRTTSSTSIRQVPIGYGRCLRST